MAHAALPEALAEAPHRLARLLLDSLGAEAEAIADEEEARKLAAPGALTWAMLAMGACCCWGLCNCICNIILMRRPMKPYGGRVRWLQNAAEWTEITSDPASGCVVLLVCAGWHRGCRITARSISKISMDYDPDTCVFVACDLARTPTVARSLNVVYIPAIKIFRAGAEVETFDQSQSATEGRFQQMIEAHGARRLDPAAAGEADAAEAASAPAQEEPVSETDHDEGRSVAEQERQQLVRTGERSEVGQLDGELASPGGAPSRPAGAQRDIELATLA